MSDEDDAHARRIAAQLRMIEEGEFAEEDEEDSDADADADGGGEDGE